MPLSSCLSTPTDDEVEVEHLKEEPRDVEFTDIGSIKCRAPDARVKSGRISTSVKLEPASPQNPLRHLEVKLELEDVKFETDGAKLEAKDVKLDLDTMKREEGILGEAPRTILTIWKRRPNPETYQPNRTTEFKYVLYPSH